MIDTCEKQFIFDFDLDEPNVQNCKLFPKVKDARIKWVMIEHYGDVRDLSFEIVQQHESKPICKAENVSLSSAITIFDFEENGVETQQFTCDHIGRSVWLILRSMDHLEGSHITISVSVDAEDEGISYSDMFEW